MVLAVPRPRFRGVRAGASVAMSDEEDSDGDFDLHWPQGPPEQHGADQQVRKLLNHSHGLMDCVDIHEYKIYNIQLYICIHMQMYIIYA